MSCCLSVYFLVVFKSILRGLRTFGFVGLKIVFWVLYVELGGLLTHSVTRLFSATSRLVETVAASASWRPYSLLPLSVPKSRAQVPSVLLPPSTLGLSTSGYTAVSMITCNFLLKETLSYLSLDIGASIDAGNFQ